VTQHVVIKTFKKKVRLVERRCKSRVPRYGIPYYRVFGESSGTLAMENEHVSVFLYEPTAPANIFRKDHVNITDIQPALNLMKSNLHKVDPL